MLSGMKPSTRFRQCCLPRLNVVTSTEVFSEWLRLLLLDYQVSNQEIFLSDPNWIGHLKIFHITYQVTLKKTDFMGRSAFSTDLTMPWKLHRITWSMISYDHTSLLEFMANAMGMVQHLYIRSGCFTSIWTTMLAILLGFSWYQP